MAARQEIVFDWGILQAIGAAGLISLLFVAKGSRARVLAALLLVSLTPTITGVLGDGVVRSCDHGGPTGSLPWAGTILLASVAGDWLDPRMMERTAWENLASGGRVLGGGMVLAVAVPVSKPLMTPSHVLLSVGISAMVFGAFVWKTDVCSRGPSF